MSEHQQQVALITGASQRIGAAFVRELAATGYSVAIQYRRSVELALALEREITGAGGNCAVFQAELSDPASCARLITSVRNTFGGLNLLVNNASTFVHDTLQTLTPESWADHLGANLTGPVFLTQAFAQAVDDAAGGLVVNILDQKVNRPNADHFAYTAGKLALAQLTPVMALALAPKVRVCGIAPGITLQSGKQSLEDYLEASRQPPLGLSSSLDDLMRALRFIIATPAMTGQILTIDGGESLLGRSSDRTYGSANDGG